MDWFKELFIDEAKAALDSIRVGYGSYQEPSVYILVDEDGNEYTAIPSDEEINLDATSNDIRIGKRAATNTGLTDGTKEIPCYVTEEGFAQIKPGEDMKIYFFTDKCHYTKLQAMVCDYNTKPSDSVAVNKASINSKVYAANSIEALSDVTVDDANLAIDLGLTNDSDNDVVIRYFTYKEVY